MPQYDIYFLTAAGHVIQPPKLISADDDDAAIQQARRISTVEGRDVVIWCGDRLIGELGPNGSVTS